MDDELANRVVFEQSLANEFSILTAPDGATAIELLERQDVAVLVTDMRMPGMSGAELLAVAKERWPHTMRIVVTAFSDVDPILRAINEGVVARYILKPWNRDELARALRWAISARAIGRDSGEIQHRLLETERLATLGSLAGMLVHDLRQPLMSLMLNIDVVQELADATPSLRQALDHAPLSAKDRLRLASLTDNLAELAADLKTSVGHMNRLVTTLSGLSRPREQTLGSERRTDPVVAVRDALSMSRQFGQRGRVVIKYDGPNNLPPVAISSTELIQVLIKLFANAAQAVSARGAAGGRVAIDARADGSNVTLVVHDNGIGMSSDVLARVGTPFFTTYPERTGLGVAQCQRLIGTAGGELRLDSELGVGTTVTVTLPIAS